MIRPDGHSSAEASQPVVLFDGACPMCSREIAHYRSVRGAETIEWIDIAAPNAPLPLDGVSLDAAMARFHVRDGARQWQTGAFGFVEMWSHLAGYRHVARALRATRLVGLLDRAYGRFAVWRLKRQCADGACLATAKNESQS